MENYHLTIKNLSEEDRPREKLLQKGKSALSDAELIAILIGSGNTKQTAVELAQYILSSCDHNLNNLAKLSVSDLRKFNGIGEAKAISIVSALEIGRRRKLSEPEKKLKLSSSEQVYAFILPELMDLSHEEFWTIYLKRNGEVIKKEQVGKGGVSGVFVDPKIIYKHAIDYVASGIIVVHNHPSGNLHPSVEDKKITERLKQAGDVLGISFMDHLIVTNHAYFSFLDEGML